MPYDGVMKPRGRGGVGAMDWGMQQSIFWGMSRNKKWGKGADEQSARGTEKTLRNNNHGNLEVYGNELGCFSWCYVYHKEEE